MNDYFNSKAADPLLSIALKHAIEICGYRYIDCAWMYRNENLIGKVLRSSIEKSNGKLKREDFFLHKRFLLQDPDETNDGQNSSKGSPTSSSEPTKPVLRKHGKLISFFR